jgi:hypothetical protein
MPEVRVPLLIRIPAALKAKLTEIANEEHRSLNQQIEYLLERSIREISSKPKTEKLKRRKTGE